MFNVEHGTQTFKVSFNPRGLHHLSNVKWQFQKIKDEKKKDRVESDQIIGSAFYSIKRPNIGFVENVAVVGTQSF